MAGDQSDRGYWLQRIAVVTPGVFCGLLGASISHFLLLGEGMHEFLGFAGWYFVMAYPIFLIGDHFWPPRGR